jgi:bacillolysin
MHSSKLAALLVLSALIWASIAGGAQAAALPLTPPPDDTLLSQLDQASGGAARVFRHAETGKVRFIGMAPGRPLQPANSLAAATPESAARAFLASYGPLFGLRDQARELTLMRQETLPGRSFVRFQQRYLGVPVLAGELIVQTDARRAVVSANGEALPDLNVAVQPTVAPDAAAEQARGVVAATYGPGAGSLSSTAPELWIYNPALLGGLGLRMSRLVWRVEVRSAAEPIRELVLVDARTGKIALHFNQIADAKKRVVCNDKNVIDLDGNQDNNCTPSDYVRVEGQGATGIADVDLAYDYAGITYDFYRNRFGRDSLDGKGLALISLVKYCPDALNCPFLNANWDGRQMTYGDGFASADDVVGHELTHGVTEFTSGLFYYYQSGAINESLSDVFGELIDLTDGRGDDADAARWMIGEDLPPSFGVLRNMKAPASPPSSYPAPFFAVSPDRMTSPDYYSFNDDSGGVHTNSGVNNKAAYLMTDGATFNGRTIKGLGISKVAAIYYTLQTALLTSGSDYEDLYNDLPAACEALAASGAYGIGGNDCDQVQKTVEATEMNQQPAFAPVPEAPICDTGETSQNIFFDDLENTASGNWASAALTGQNDWYYPVSSNPYDPSLLYTTSGKQSLWGNDAGASEQQPIDPADYAIAMTKDVAVPSSAYMHFRHAYDFEAGFDGGVVEYSTDSGQSWHDAGALFTDNPYLSSIDSGSSNPLAGREVFSGISQGYYSSRLDLSTLEGEHARFRFRIGVDEINPADGNYYYGWFIDDIRVYTCSATLPKVTWRESVVNVPEAARDILLQVRLSGATDQPVEVPFSVGGSATRGADYALTAGKAIIPPGAASVSVPLRIIDDQFAEGNETIVITFGTPSNATLGATKTVVVTIAANDAGLRRTYLPLAQKSS